LSRVSSDNPNGTKGHLPPQVPVAEVALEETAELVVETLLLAVVCAELVVVFTLELDVQSPQVPVAEVAALVLTVL